MAATQGAIYSITRAHEDVPSHASTKNRIAKHPWWFNLTLWRPPAGRCGSKVSLFALMAWMGLKAIESVPEAWVHQIFSGPAAHAAGILLGIPVFDAGEPGRLFWLLPHPILDLHVGRECSGMNFFLLALLLLAWSQGRPGNLRYVFGLLMLPLVAYLATVGANALRLAAVFQARLIAEWLLPPSFFGLVHLAAGGLVFVSILILLHLLHERILQLRAA